jgi:hypothetical protein
LVLPFEFLAAIRLAAGPANALDGHIDGEGDLGNLAVAIDVAS